MIRKTMLAIAVLLAGMTAQALAAEDCKLVLVASLDIDPAYPDRVMVSPMLDGTPVKMIIDSGGIATMVTEDTALTFKLRHIGIPLSSIISGYNGATVRFKTVIPSLQTGNLHASDVQALIFPTPLEKGVAGLIGPDLLMHYEVELDFKQNKINLFSPDHCPGQLVYWTHDPVATIPIRVDGSGHIEVDVTLDGKELRGLIDTGAPWAAMKMTAARRAFDLAPDSPGMAHESPERPENYLYTFKSLVLGGIAISNPKVRISDLPAIPPETRLLLVGLSELKKLHVMISYKEHMLYATGVNAH